MLPKIVRLRSGLSPRSRWSLALLGFALLSLPTWYQEAQSRQVLIPQGYKSAAEKGNSTEGQPAADSAAEKNVQEGKPADQPPAPVAGGAPAGPVGMGGGMGNGGRGGNVLGRTPITTSVKRPKLPAMAPPTVEFFPLPSPDEKELLTTLEQKVEFEFSALSLVQIVEELGVKYGIQMILDKQALEEESIDPTAKDITCQLKGIPLKSALKIMLDAKSLAFVVADDVVKVTTEGKASQVRVARTYPVRDLVSNVDVDYLLLCRAIHNGVGGDDAGDPWVEIDGEGGSISILPASGCLVVRHTARVQQGVLQLLRSIRGANEEAEAKGESSVTHSTR